MAINLASKASPKVVERFKIGSCTEGLFSNDYEWTGVATVRVYSVDTLPLQTYDRTKVDGSSRFGTLSEVGDTYQEMTVQDEKSFNGTIDRGNNESQLMIKSAGRVLRRELDEVVIPYVDKYRLNVLANGAKAAMIDGNVSLTKANVIEAIMTGNAKLSNLLVPDTGRVLYIGYTEAIKLKLADQVVGIDKLGEKAIVNGVCGKIDKCQIRLVPDSYMPEIGTGANAKQVKFFIVKTGISLAPKKIQTYRVLTETHILDGAMVQGRLLHDCFVLNTKKDGIYVATE